VLVVEVLLLRLLRLPERQMTEVATGARVFEHQP
jgi:hypothetical protein